jgi:hypothetical protein
MRATMGWTRNSRKEPARIAATNSQRVVRVPACGITSSIAFSIASGLCAAVQRLGLPMDEPRAEIQEV